MSLSHLALLLGLFPTSSVGAHPALSAAQRPDERPFLAANAAAMNRMMTGMAARPTGDVDRDFTEMMIPHHQGAIDMAVAELSYGHDDRLKRIAQEIIVDQQQEIAAMRLALGDQPPPAAPAPTQAPQPTEPARTRSVQRTIP